MKLQNKETGEIRKGEAREDGIYLYDEITGQWYKYELDLLARGWKYYEEEAEKVVEKLKAWKRLKQGGFHWNSWALGVAHFGVDLYDGYNNDLDLVFGGEE